MPGRAARQSVQDLPGPSPSCSHIWFPNWGEGASEWTISGSKSTGPCSRLYECVSALHLWSRGRCSVPDGRQWGGEAKLRPYRPLPANASWWQEGPPPPPPPSKSLMCFKYFRNKRNTVMTNYCDAPLPNLSCSNVQRTEDFILSFQILHSEWRYKQILPPVGQIH